MSAAGGFVMETARLLAILHDNKGYSLHKLLSLTRRSLLRFPSIFGGRSSVGVFISIRLQLKVYLESGSFRLLCV